MESDIEEWGPYICVFSVVVKDVEFREEVSEGAFSINPCPKAYCYYIHRNSVKTTSEKNIIYLRGSFTERKFHSLSL